MSGEFEACDLVEATAKEAKNGATYPTETDKIYDLFTDAILELRRNYEKHYHASSGYFSNVLLEERADRIENPINRQDNIESKEPGEGKPIC